MNLAAFLPSRCLHCGEPLASGDLCRACWARFQPSAPPEAGLGLCPLCGQVRLAEQHLCMDCGAQPWSFPGLDGLWGYHDPGGELIRLYKLGGVSPLADAWASASAARLFPRGPLVPVPSMRRSRWRRGWDPVAYLVRRLAREAGVPVWNALVRCPSAAQKTLTKAERKTNAQRAYRLARWPPGGLAGTPLVWLIDDVVTTGATVEACSRILVDAGVREVRVFCLGLH